jgi:hypothetical protein
VINGNQSQGAAYAFVGPKEAPMATIAPSTMMFAPQPVGTASPSQSFTVTNIGEDPVQVFNVHVSNQGPLTTTRNCVAASPLPPGGTCTEQVQFVPLVVGTAHAGIWVESDTVGAGDCCVSVQGTGVKIDTATSIVSVSADPAFVGQPVTVNFTVVPTVNTTATRQGTVTVQANTGESCSAEVAVGSCNLVFTTPIDRVIKASYSGDASFNSSTSSDGAIRVADFGLALSPSSQTVSGRKTSFTVVATSQNGFTGNVALTCSGPQGATCAINPASVSVGGSSALAKATITLPAGTASGGYTFTFKGTSGGVTRSATALVIAR